MAAEDNYDLATARIAAAHAAFQSAEAGFESARLHVPEYIALEAAERGLAAADEAYWRGAESPALLAVRLAARQAVSEARRSYQEAREAMPEYAEVIGAQAALDRAIRDRDASWPPFSRTAARLEQLAAATDDR